MMPLEASVSNALIWRVTLELSIMILEASFLLIYDVYSTIGNNILYRNKHVNLISASQNFQPTSHA
jgi:hypothetical protein